jgi:hypothetical protein
MKRQHLELGHYCFIQHPFFLFSFFFLFIIIIITNFLFTIFISSPFYLDGLGCLACSYSQLITKLLILWRVGKILGHKQNKRRQASMPAVEFEPMISVFERAKTLRVLDRAATVTCQHAFPFNLILSLGVT